MGMILLRKNININNKILKYSIRKLSFGVAPIIVGMLMFGSYAPMQEVLATDVNFKYVEKNELNENEKKLIKESIPSIKDDILRIKFIFLLFILPP